MRFSVFIAVSFRKIVALQDYQADYRKKNKKHIASLQKDWKEKNQLHIKDYQHQRQEMIRLEAVRVYSGGTMQCVCCRDSHVQFLGVEGNRPKGISNIYLWLKKNNFPLGFQILCMNCKTGKNTLGQCPHVSEKKGYW